MREFFELLDQYTDIAIGIAFFIYLMIDCITSNVRKKK